MRLLLVVVSFALICGCKIIDPAEEIPSYINISEVSLTTNLSTEGSSSAKITDAWIYVDGKLIGGFEIPCTVPVLTEGIHSVLVLPGIKQNGMASMRAIYPFYKGWESNVELTRGRVDTLSPAFTYFPGTNFRWNCDFESSGTNFIPNDPWMMGTPMGPNAFEGNSACIYVDTTDSFFHAESNLAYDLDASHEIYLECNYKSTQPFVVGLRNNDISNGPTIICAVVNPSDSWDKIYIRMNEVVYGHLAGTRFSVVIEMANPPDQYSSTLWLDNMKLIN